jgi:hypothetical protein
MKIFRQAKARFPQQRRRAQLASNIVSFRTVVTEFAMRKLRQRIDTPDRTKKHQSQALARFFKAFRPESPADTRVSFQRTTR